MKTLAIYGSIDAEPAVSASSSDASRNFSSDRVFAQQFGSRYGSQAIGLRYGKQPRVLGCEFARSPGDRHIAEGIHPP